MCGSIILFVQRLATQMALLSYGGESYRGHINLCLSGDLTDRANISGASHVIKRKEYAFSHFIPNTPPQKKQSFRPAFCPAFPTCFAFQMDHHPIRTECPLPQRSPGGLSGCKLVNETPFPLIGHNIWLVKLRNTLVHLKNVIFNHTRCC